MYDNENIHEKMEGNMDMEDGEESYPLHESIFKGDIATVSKLLRTCDVSKKDKHGIYSYIVH